jgi:hypothetical protein
VLLELSGAVRKALLSVKIPEMQCFPRIRLSDRGQALPIRDELGHTNKGQQPAFNSLEGRKL